MASMLIQRLVSIPMVFVGLLSVDFLSSVSIAGSTDTGAKGADIYCFMRESGNTHEVSWNASYEVMKRQANSIFKTSPKHGAVMILEAVVKNPTNYENCSSYLGDLFETPKLEEIVNNQEVNETETDKYSY